MRLGWIAWLALAALVALNACQEQEPPGAAQGWQELAPQGARFAVSLPGTPVEETREEHGLGGVTVVHRFSLQPEGEGPSYRVDWFEYPPDLLGGLTELAGGQPETLVRANGQQLVIELEGTVVSETLLSLDGHPGKELSIDGPEGRTTIARVYLIADGLYRLIVTSPPETSPGDEVQRFFDSFRPL